MRRSPQPIKLPLGDIWLIFIIWEKSYLVLKFSSDLNLILRFLISKIKFLGFSYVLNRSLCYFFVKINGLSFAICVSFNMSASTYFNNIDKCHIIYLSIYILKKKKKKTASFIKTKTLHHALHHIINPVAIDKVLVRKKKKKKPYLGFFFFRNKLKN
jgi:hypothetical protein